jgi:hypothetical protein
MSSKLIQPDFFQETVKMEKEKESKPYKNITEEEFTDFVKESLACLFSSYGKLMKLNEYLILHSYTANDAIVAQQKEINSLKNP